MKKLNQKTKKIVTYSGVGAVLAGAVTGITVPIVTHKDDKTTVLEHINRSEVVWNDGTRDITLGEVLDTVKKDNPNKNIRLDATQKEAAKYLYEKEAAGSLDLQVMWFKYRLFEIKYQIGVAGTVAGTFVDENGNAETKSLKARIKALDDQLATPGISNDNKTKWTREKETLNKQIDDLNQEIREVEQKIDNVENKNLNFDSSTFSSDYPKILKPISTIRSKQEKILLDQKHNFVNQYGTEGDGKKSWVEERSSKYNGATSDDMAIDSMVYGVIKNQAYTQFKFSLATEFTTKHKIAKDKNGAPIFGFLQNVVSKKTDATSTVVDTDLTNKLFFLSTASRIPSKIHVDLTDTTSAGINGSTLATMVKAKDFTILKHYLLKVTQDATGYTLPWKITKDQAKMLLKHYGTTGTSQTNVFDALRDVFKDNTSNTYTDVEKKRDKFLIEMFSENSEGTKKKSGLLGIKPSLQQAKGMVPGFVLGLIDGNKELYDGTDGTSTILDDMLDAIRDTAKAKLSLSFDGSASPSTNDQIDQAIDHMNKDEFEKSFGSAIRDVFYKGTDKPQLSYELPGNRLLVISKFGIHIIKNEKLDLTNLDTKLTETVKKAFDEQDIKDIEIDFASIFNQTLTQDRVILEMFNKIPEFKTLIETNVKDADDKNVVAADIIKMLEDKIKGESIGLVGSVLDGIIDSHYIDHIDKQLLGAPANANNAIAEIYKEAETMGGII